MTTPRVTVPVDVLRELIDASSEVRDLLANVPEMQDRKYVGTGNRFVNAIGAAQRSYLSAAPAPEGGAEVPSSWSIRYQGLATREEAPAEAEELDRAIKRMRNQLVGSATFTQLMFGREDVRLILDTLSALRAQPPAREDAQPVAWARRWFIDGEEPRKERNAKGRMAWPKKFTFHKVTEAKVMKDDVPLYTHPAPDALRVAVEAFMPSAEVAFLWAKEAPPADEVQRYRERYWAVKEALAALQAEQGAK